MGLGLMKPRPLSEAFGGGRTGQPGAVIIVENDLYRRAPGEEVTAFLDSRYVVVVDHLKTRTTDRADLVLPAGTFAETDGTLVNHEGRAQRFFQAFVPSGEVRPSWRWLGGGLLLQKGSERECQWQSLDEIVSAIAKEMPLLAPIENAAPRKEFGKVAREPGRYSGRTSMLANLSVHEPKPPADPDSALAFSMESGLQPPSPALLPFFWSPGWNSIQSVNKFQSEVGSSLRGGDPGVRLLQPADGSSWRYVSRIPSAFNPDSRQRLFLPRFYIFGSEELSRRAPGIAELVPRAVIGLNVTDAARLGLKAGELLNMTIGDSVYELEVSLSPHIARGTAIIPVGIPPFEELSIPTRGKLAPSGATANGVLR